MSNLRSSVGWTSNLLPVTSKFSCTADKSFCAKIRDVNALREMRRLKPNFPAISLTAEQKSLLIGSDCSYANKDEIPWGTILLPNGTQKYVCKCRNSICEHRNECWNDYVLDEYDVNLMNTGR